MRRTPEDDARFKAAIQKGTLNAEAVLASPGMATLLSDEDRQLLVEQVDEARGLSETLSNWQRSKWTEAGAPKDVASLRRYATRRKSAADILEEQGEVR